MSDSRKFLFLGTGSANLIWPIADYMADRAFDVTKLDLLTEKHPRDILNTFIGRETVFVTANHFIMDRANYLRATWFSSESIAPLEIMDLLKPVKSVFYPHDLFEFAEMDKPFIDLFDVILWPYRNNWFYYLCNEVERTEIVGWIKKRQSPRRENTGEKDIEHLRLLYLPSNLYTCFNKYGVEGWANILDGHLSNMNDAIDVVNIKLVNLDKKEFDRFAQLLQNKGYRVLNKALSVFELLDRYDLVMTDGISSVVYECALSGRPVISIIGDDHSDESCADTLPAYPWVYPLHVCELYDFLIGIKTGNQKLSYGKDILKPFDMKAAVTLITEC
jgi:hypothetical protein